MLRKRKYRQEEDNELGAAAKKLEIEIGQRITAFIVSKPAI